MSRQKANVYFFSHFKYNKKRLGFLQRSTGSYMSETFPTKSHQRNYTTFLVNMEEFDKLESFFNFI